MASYEGSFVRNPIINDKLYGFEVLGFRDKTGSVILKVGQGCGKWVSVLRSIRGPYQYRFHVCSINFVCLLTCYS